MAGNTGVAEIKIDDHRAISKRQLNLQNSTLSSPRTTRLTQLQANINLNSSGNILCQLQQTSSSLDLNKDTLLEVLEPKIRIMADKVLASINQTADDCPYIRKWFGYYSEKEESHILDAIAKFAPATKTASDRESYIAAVIKRVEQGLRNHVATGTLADVPSEIIDEEHQPEDFLHIAEKSGVAQLSCLWNRGGRKPNKGPNYQDLERGEEAQERRPRIATHLITQGGTKMVNIGDRVQNAGTTSCGLVIAFGSDGVGCFHWPFMTDSSGYHGTFNEVVGNVGTLQRVIIVTNDFPKPAARAHYVNTARSIRDRHGTTDYFVIQGQIVGDPFGTIGNGTFVSLMGTLKRVNYDE